MTCDPNNETLANVGYCKKVAEDPSLCSLCDPFEAHGDETNETCLSKQIVINDELADSWGNHSKCVNLKCVGTVDGSGGGNSKCESENQTCHPGACQIASCDENGKCVITDNPPDLRKPGPCEDKVCNFQTRMFEIVNRTCPNPDRCNVGYCDIESDRCLSKFKEEKENCTDYSCDLETGVVTRTERNCSYMESNNSCARYRCEPSSDKCVFSFVEDKETACPTDNPNCTIVTCNAETSYICQYQPREEKSDDKCLVSKCDPATGKIYFVEKCAVSLKCIIGVCHADGVCMNETNECQTLTVPSELERCFIPSCSEKRKSGCYLKAVQNAYFDECGNCIGFNTGEDDPTQQQSKDCKQNLLPVVTEIAAGVVAAIVVACVIAAIGVSIGSTLLTRELVRRARAAADTGAVDNPMYQDNGREMSNPAFEGENMDD